MSSKNCTIEILLIEDNPSDIVLLEEIIADTEIVCTLNVARDGEEAIAFLRGQGSHSSSPQPNLILLDLNIPKKNGHEVLREIKEDPLLKHIPVIVLTTSQAEDDILKSYQLHANCYLVKPSSAEEFVDMVKSIEMFWFNTTRLPSCSRMTKGENCNP